MEFSDLQLNLDESFGGGLVRISRELAVASNELIVRPVENRTEDIHNCRLLIKFARALVRLIRPVTGKSFFAEEDETVKTAAVDLGKFRDTDITRQLVSSLIDKSRKSDEMRALGHLLDTLQLPAKANVESGKEIENALKNASDALKALAERFEQCPFDDDGWKNVEAGFEKEYRQARSFMKKSFSKGRVEDFHAWRKHTKALYYQLLLIAPAWPKHIRKIFKSLKQLHSKLGDDHDLAVLQNRLRENSENFEIGKIKKILNQRSQRLRKQSFRIGDKLLAEKPRRFTRSLEKHWSCSS